MPRLALPLALAVLAAHPPAHAQRQPVAAVQLEPGLTVALPEAPRSVDFTLEDPQAGTVRSVTWTRVAGGISFVAGYLEAKPSWARAQGPDALLDLGQRHLFASDVQVREAQAQRHLGRPARALRGASPAASERALLFADGRRVYFTRLREPGSARAPNGDAFLTSLTPAGAAPADAAAVELRRYDIAPGQTVSWQLEPQQGPARAQDAFVFRGRAGERVEVVLRTSAFQPTLRVAQAAGDDVARAPRVLEERASDSTGTRGVYVTLTLPEDGLYALLPGGEGTGPYTLSLEVEAQRREPPRAAPATTQLVPGRAHRGRLVPTDAVDARFRPFQRFTFDAREDVTYELRVEAPGLPDLYEDSVRVRLPDGEPVTDTRLQTQGGGKVVLRFRAVDAGAYQVELAAPSHETRLPEAFTLSVAEEGAAVAGAPEGPTVVNATPARDLTFVASGSFGLASVSDQDGLFLGLDLVLGLGGQPTPVVGLDVVVSPGLLANSDTPEGEAELRFVGLAGPRLRLGHRDGNSVAVAAGLALLTAPSEGAEHSALGLGGRVDWMPFGDTDDVEVGLGGRFQKHGDVTLLMGGLTVIF